MDRNARKFGCQVQKIREQIEKGTLPFAECLSSELVQEAVAQLGLEFRERIYTPWVTLWAFLSQVMSCDGSCSFAVSQVIAYCLEHHKKPCSPSTTTYCEARNRLPEEFYARLVRKTGRQASKETLQPWRFHERVVKVVDGTTASMPDTEENREAFPLQDPDRAGLSFPMARLLVVFSLAVGTVLECAISPYRGKGTGEHSMFRSMIDGDVFEPGDICLADAGFCSYAHVAALWFKGVDVVVKLEKTRRGNLTFIKRLGRNKQDGLYLWKKPKRVSESFSREDVDALPDEIQVRLVTVDVSEPGFRVRKFDVLTTLTDHRHYTADELAKLFRLRWKCELFLRDIKSTLGMDQLRCKSPETVRKEIFTHLLAYNLIRIQMAQAAACVGIQPTEISFKTAAKTITVFQNRFPNPSTDQLATMLATLAYHRVDKQPNRIEPRKVKRRPSHEYLTRPREDERKSLSEKHLKLSA